VEKILKSLVRYLEKTEREEAILDYCNDRYAFIRLMAMEVTAVELDRVIIFRYYGHIHKSCRPLLLERDGFELTQCCVYGILLNAEHAITIGRHPCGKLLF
jgi:hypothetical protein